MASSIPTALKSADISRFALRAAQVEKAKPVVAYWCNYWVVNQILSKGLHNADDESMTYTMTLMDKLEQTKAEHPENDAIIDDVAGQAYVEHFGLETFQRADNAMKANKASRQTADTFFASATFLELSHIWGTLDPELASKIKFAKYHALRIAKALKAGEDPNLSNPAPESSPTQEQPPLDPNDPDVQAITGSVPSNLDIDRLQQSSVEEVPDDHDRIQHRLAQTSTLDESLHPSRAASIARPNAPDHDHNSPYAAPSHQDTDWNHYDHTDPPGGVSPIESSTLNRATSEGGGYFPKTPGDIGSVGNPSLPEAPSEIPGSPPIMDLPDPSSLPPPSSREDRLQRQPDGLNSFPTHFDPPLHIDPTDIPQYPPAHQHPSYSQAPSAPNFMPQARPRTSHPAPAPLAPQRVHARPTAPQQENSLVNYVADEEAILKAQKHARWAISALNFEDVDTAVIELRGALQSLGAS